MKKLKFVLSLGIIAILAISLFASTSPVGLPLNAMRASEQPVEAYSLSETALTSLPWLKVDGKWIKDEHGNIIILRGCNYMGLSFNRSDVDERNILRESDIKRMKSWGFNVMRLSIAWSFIEPEEHEPPKYNDDYLRRIDQIIEWCKKYGLYVILDTHFYYFSAKFEGDYGIPGNGAPLWAVKKYEHNFEAVDAFWYDEDKIQTKFANMWNYVAKRYKNESTVAGYDIYGEPSPGQHPVDKGFTYKIEPDEFTDILYDFYTKVIKAIREVDTNHMIIYSAVIPPTAWVAESKKIKIDNNLIFSIHPYPGLFINPYLCHEVSQSFENTGYHRDKHKHLLEEAILGSDRLGPGYLKTTEWGIPLWIGEFGIQKRVWGAREWTVDMLNFMDKYMLGYAWWVYWSDDNKHDWWFGLHWMDGAVNEEIIDVLDRVYPMSISREPSSFSYEVTSWRTTSYDMFKIIYSYYNFKIDFPATGEDIVGKIHIPQSFPIDFHVYSTTNKWDYSWDPENRVLTFSVETPPLEKVTFVIEAGSDVLADTIDLWLKPSGTPLTRRAARIDDVSPGDHVTIYDPYLSLSLSVPLNSPLCVTKTFWISNYNSYQRVIVWNGLNNGGFPCNPKTIRKPSGVYYYTINEEREWRWTTLGDDLRAPEITEVYQEGNSIHFRLLDPDSPGAYVKINVYHTWGEFITSLLGDELSNHWEFRTNGAYNVAMANLPPGKYLVKIKAIDASGNEYPTDRMRPDPPELLRPPQCSVISNPRPAFSWLDATDPPPSSGISYYEIEIDNDTDFSSPLSALFTDNFNDGEDLGWKKHALSGPWQVISGEYRQIDPIEYAMEQGYGTYNFAYVPDVGTDLVLTAKVTLLEPPKQEKDVALGIFVHNPDGETYNKWALVFHYNYHTYDSEEYSTLSLLEEWVDWRDSVPFVMRPGIPYWFKMKVNGNEVWGKAWRVGEPEPPWMVHDLFKENIYDKAIGVYSSHHKASFDDVTVMPINFLLDNDFNTGDVSAWSAWKYQPDTSPWWWYTSASWIVENGEYVGRDPLHMYNYAGDQCWTDYAVSVRAKPTTPGWRVALRARVQDGENFYQIHSYEDGLRISKIYRESPHPGEGVRVIDYKWIATHIPLNEWHSLKIKCNGDHIYFYFNGELQHLEVDDQFPSGGIGLGAWSEKGIEVHFDDVKVVKLLRDTQFQPEVPLFAGRYWWRVRAVDNAGNVGEWSEPRSFTSTFLPEGGLAVAVNPKVTETTAGTEITVNILVVNNENFDDVITVKLGLEGIPPAYRADLAWMNWTEQRIFLPSGDRYIIPLIIRIPAGTPSGYYAFNVEATSAVWDKGYAMTSGAIKVG